MSSASPAEHVRAAELAPAVPQVPIDVPHDRQCGAVPRQQAVGQAAEGVHEVQEHHPHLHGVQRRHRCHQVAHDGVHPEGHRRAAVDPLQLQQRSLVGTAGALHQYRHRSRLRSRARVVPRPEPPADVEECVDGLSRPTVEVGGGGE